MEIKGLRDFIKNYEHGVYNFTHDGKCSRCGNCCSNILPLSTDEIKKIARYKKKHHLKDMSYRDDIDFNMVCPFLDKKNMVCTIYEIRPLICSDFICNKRQPDIDKEREYMYHTRKAVYMREEFFK